jgi:uncharacterized membrane protein YeaQ/YmgE (transglycosylase-associated protein family)
MNFVVWLLVGGASGFLASIFWGTPDGKGYAINMLAGVVGAVVTGWFLTGLFAPLPGDQASLSVPGLLVAFVGASVMLPLVNAVRGAFA